MADTIKISREDAGDGTAKMRRAHKRRSRKEMKTLLDGDPKREALEGSGDAPTPVTEYPEVRRPTLNKIQEATVSILKAGLNQISWEPLLTLLEDLISNGSVSRKKLHRCAKKVIHKILGADLETRVLQQFHTDVDVGEIIMIESLIASYVDELNEKRSVKTGDDTRSVSVTSTAEEKRRKNAKDERKKDKNGDTPSYLKTTESFRRKQTNRQGGSRRIDKKRFVKRNLRDGIETDFESKRDDSVTSDHELNRIIWTEIDDRNLANPEEATEPADRTDKKQVGRKQIVAKKNKRKVDGRGDWDKIETVTAMKTYAHEITKKSPAVKTPIINEDRNSIDNSPSKDIKSHTDAAATDKKNKTQSASNIGSKEESIKGDIRGVTPEKDESALTKVRPFIERLETTDERVDGTKADFDKVAIEKNDEIPDFSRTTVKPSEETTPSTAANKVKENECAKYCNRTTNTETVYYVSEKWRSPTPSSSSHSMTDLDLKSNGSEPAPITVSDHQLEILKRKFFVRKTREHSLHYHRIPDAEIGLPYIEIEKLRCFFKFILSLGLIDSIDTGPYSPYFKHVMDRIIKN